MSGEVNVEGLRRAAEAATPGPWERSGYDVYETVTDIGECVAEAGLSGSDARYIAAASPDVVLALLDQLAEMRRLNRQLENDVERVTATVARAQRVVAMYDNVDAIVPQEWPTMGETVVNALRDALDSQRHTGTHDASQAADGPLSASEGHVGRGEGLG